MRFLVDEDVPAKLLKFLVSRGFDSLRVDSGASDLANIQRSKKEGRVFITLDKDFASFATASPGEFDVVFFRIHPPYADSLVAAFDNLLKNPDPAGIKGFITLTETGHIRYR